MKIGRLIIGLPMFFWAMSKDCLEVDCPYWLRLSLIFGGLALIITGLQKHTP